MSRLTVLTLDSAPTATHDRLVKAVQTNGFLPNLLGVLANAPIALAAYQDLSALNATASLSLDEREIVQLVAATHNGCAFCVAGHTAIAKKKSSLSTGTIEALRNQAPHAIEDARLLELALFTQHIIDQKAQLSDAQLQAFFDAGFTQQQALEVIVGVGLATICNFANNLAQTPINPELQEHAWATP